MIRWAIFITLWLVHLIASEWLIPITHRRNYNACRLDFTCKAALACQQGIWVTALAQYFLLPSPELPGLLRIIGAVLMVTGNALVVAARKINYFFVPIVIYVPPKMRETRGAYKFCTHPGYLGFALAAVGVFLLLGQAFAAIPTITYLYILLRRVKFEDRVLSGEMPL
jgi:protein-S-isoprenylcysteine O-methyltransferase Ste14